ncbi:acyl-CoA thioesterase [Bdellovibrio bacteriovorus]
MSSNTYTLLPRFHDTDALGHINNAAYATWFEEARRFIFRFFVPDLDPKKWSLIIARTEFDFLAQGYYQKEVTVTTNIEKVGNSSFVVVQEAVQDNVVIGKGKAFMVHFDYKTNKSVPIPQNIKEELQKLIK